MTTETRQPLSETDLGLESPTVETAASSDKFAEAFAGVPDPDISVQVFRRPETGKWEFCFGFALGEYTESDLYDYIALEYGPGTYPVQGSKQRSKRDKRRQIVFQKDLKIAGRRRPQHAAATTPAPISDNNAIAAALDNNTRLLAKLLEKDSAPAPSVFDMLEKLSSIKDLFTPAAAPDPFNMVTQVIALMKEIREQDPSGDSDPWAAALKHLAPSIGKGIEALQEDQQRRVPAMAGPSRRPIPLGQQRAMKTRTNADAGEKVTIDARNAPVFIVQFLPLALSQAADEADPISVSQLVLGFINEDNLDDVLDLICHEDMIGYLAQFDPRARQYADWLNRVADLLAEELIPEEGAEGAQVDTGAPPKTPENATKSATIEQPGPKPDIKAVPSQAPAADATPGSDANDTTTPVAAPGDDAHPPGDPPGE